MINNHSLSFEAQRFAHKGSAYSAAALREIVGSKNGTG